MGLYMRQIQVVRMQFFRTLYSSNSLIIEMNPLLRNKPEYSRTNKNITHV